MDRTDRKWAFDHVAAEYDAVRPGYDEALIDEIVAYAALPPQARIVEVGCGTGQATLGFARRGYRISCLELGPNLAARARQNLAAYPDVEIATTSFEAWPPQLAAFDLFLSAQAFHWIEPSFGLRRAAQLLRPAASLALLWHIDDSADTDLYRATTPIYRRFFPAGNKPLAQRGPQTAVVALRASEHFEDLQTHGLRWQQVYAKAEYLTLLRTHSDCAALDAVQRAAFECEVAAVIDRFGGSVRRSFRTELALARRNGLPA